MSKIIVQQRRFLPGFFLLAIALASLHVFPATSELHCGSCSLWPDQRVVLLGNQRPGRPPFAYGDRIRLLALDDLVLVYQRYKDSSLLETVRLASAFQRRGCHFITGVQCLRLFHLRRVPYGFKPYSDLLESRKVFDSYESRSSKLLKFQNLSIHLCTY